LGEYLKVFYGRRMLRIFPLYYLYLGLISTGIYYFMHVHGVRFTDMLVAMDQLPYALTYVYNFFHATTSFQNNEFLTHFWSLAVEEQFYLIWPFLIYFAVRKNLKMFLIMVVLSGPVLRAITFFYFNHSSLTFLTDNSLMAVYVSPFSHLDAFAMGGLLSQIKIKNAPKLFLAAIVIGVAAGYGSYLITGYPIRTLSSLGYPLYMAMGFYKMLWGYTMLNIVFGLWIYCAGAEPGVQRWFENKVMIYLGKISYGLYIFHLPVIYLTKVLIKMYELPVPLLAKIVIDLFLVVGIASLSYRYFERYFLGLKDYMFKKKNPHAEVVKA
jgi:peptidoglycan/LPS O-acetylase OafA/YrhL